MEEEITKLEQLNRFTRREFTAEEVFLFDVHLCDNEIDRDGERFSLEALSDLQTLFVGKTGIFDHNPKGENQTARIFATELVADVSRETAAGEVYTYLKGHAYMVRTDANRDLILEIDGGIKKEVSISCTAQSQCCSICGRDRRKNPCSHHTGTQYGNKTCHVVLSDIQDAYEWSFVAIPAQREAGVTKQFGAASDTEKQCQQLQAQLRQKDLLLSQVEQKIRQDITRLRFLVEGKEGQDAVSLAVKYMDLPHLLEFQDSLRTKQKKMCKSQLNLEETDGKASGNQAFKIRQSSEASQ